MASTGCLVPRPVTLPAASGEQGNVAESSAPAIVIAEALAAPPNRELKIESECRAEAGFVSAVIYGHGVAIWDRHTAITLEPNEIERVIAAMHRHGFAAMRELYGGKGDSSPDPALGLELICRVRFSKGEIEKQVVQLSEGRQHATLQALAEEILAAVEARRGEGVTASSLSDGLERLGRGELPVEVLRIEVLEQAERPSQGGARRRISLADGQLVAAVDETSRTKWLAVDEVSALADELAAAHPESWPGNLFAETYIDFSLAVLGFEKNVQARGFAGMDEETHGDAQRRFNRFLIRLGDLAN